MICLNIGYDLNLTQEQKLIMTIEMKQSIKVLQMSTFELMEYIDKEIQENIVLEYSEAKANEEVKEMENEAAAYNRLVNYLELENYDGKSKYRDAGKYEISPMDFISESPTLKDYLRDQIVYLNISKSDEIICRYIIDDLDSRGYLEESSVGGIAEELKISKAQADRCIAIIQDLEPAGVGARGLTECLMIQVRREGIEDDILKRIIEEFLPEIGEGNIRKVAKRLNVTEKKIQQCAELIRKFEPIPSRGFFTGEEIGYIVPDVYIKKSQDKYVVLPNDNLIPDIVINGEYKSMLEGNIDKSTSKYIKEKMESANSLVKSIKGRQNTICRVVSEIVKIQGDRLEKTEKDIKPMAIKDIAEILGMHESTVSRAVKDKYVSLPSGRIIKIRNLFSGKVNNDSDISSKSIKHKIKMYIDKEDKRRPLSDSDICNLLKDVGIEISRRTVAKYRDEQEILSSSKRRRVE